MVLFEPFRVMPHDVDAAGHMKISALMRYMEEIAYRHMNKNGPTAEALRAEGRAFVLSRIMLVDESALVHGDEFEVGTWAEPSAGAAFGRAFVVKVGGIEAARARTVWTLYDFGEHKIVRVRDFPSDYNAEAPIDMELPRRVSLPASVAYDDFSHLCDKRVEYADVDENRHMNNTVYADMFCGCVPEISRDGRRAATVFINYSHECALGEVIAVDGIEVAGDAWYMRSRKADGALNAEARITYR